METEITDRSMINKRIGALQLRKASYLGKEPEHPSFHINKWEPNSYYGNEHMFVDMGDYYTYPDDKYASIHISKGCFKHPETSYAVASFDWNDREEAYELRFVSDRPVYLTKEEKDIFWDLAEMGYKELNKHEYEED